MRKTKVILKTILFFLSYLSTLDSQIVHGEYSEEHKIIMLRDMHVSSDVSKEQRLCLLYGLEKVNNETALLIEDFPLGREILTEEENIEEKRFLVNLTKKVETLDLGPHISMRNIENQFAIGRTEMHFAYPCLHSLISSPFHFKGDFPPSRASKDRFCNNYEITFKNFFDESYLLCGELSARIIVERWREERSESYFQQVLRRSKNLTCPMFGKKKYINMRPSNIAEERLIKGFQAIEDLKEILEELGIGHEQSTLKTALFLLLDTIKKLHPDRTTDVKDLKVKLNRFIEDFPHNMSDEDWEKKSDEIKRLFQSLILEKTEAEVFRGWRYIYNPTREIYKLLVKIRDPLIEIHTFLLMLDAMKKNMNVLVFAGDRHIENIIKMLKKMSVAMTPIPDREVWTENFDRICDKENCVRPGFFNNRLVSMLNGDFHPRY